jgi:hypothetical protein
MDVTDLTENHPAVDGTDTRYGHDDRVEGRDNVCDLRLDRSDLAIQKLDLGDRLGDLNG